LAPAGLPRFSLQSWCELKIQLPLCSPGDVRFHENFAGSAHN
jgi:hypothetical protein